MQMGFSEENSGEMFDDLDDVDGWMGVDGVMLCVDVNEEDVRGELMELYEWSSKEND